jgi:hypothetical protein
MFLSSNLENMDVEPLVEGVSVEELLQICGGTEYEIYSSVQSI